MFPAVPLLFPLLFFSPLLEYLAAANDAAYLADEIADVTTKVASRHVARATYLFGRVLIHHARPLSESYHHVGYRADDKFNPPFRTNFADLVLWHRADPCTQIAVDLRAREEYKTRREPCGANKQLQGRTWICANGWSLGQRMAELTRDGRDMVPATGAGTRALDQGCSATPAGLGPLRVTSPDLSGGRKI